MFKTEVDFSQERAKIHINTAVIFMHHQCKCKTYVQLIFLRVAGSMKFSERFVNMMTIQQQNGYRTGQNMQYLYNASRLSSLQEKARSWRRAYSDNDIIILFIKCFPRALFCKQSIGRFFKIEIFYDFSIERYNYFFMNATPKYFNNIKFIGDTWILI